MGFDGEARRYGGTCSNRYRQKPAFDPLELGGNAQPVRVLSHKCPWGSLHLMIGISNGCDVSNSYDY